MEGCYSEMLVVYASAEGIVEDIPIFDSIGEGDYVPASTYCAVLYNQQK